MAVRLHEVHPSLVHVPITLLPLAVGADALGRVTGDERLLSVGKWAMAASAASGALAGVFGLVAQEEVNVEGPSMDMLITHRNLNVGIVALTTFMAVRRARKARPSLRYLMAGLGAVGGLLYSAYLGGTLVYRHGVGVEPANGLWQGGGPEVSAENAERVRRAFTHDLGMGLVHFARELGEGKLVPTLTGDGAGPETPTTTGTRRAAAD